MAVFAVLMMVIQLLQGTGFVYALLHFFFLLLWVTAFNLAGGFTRATGAYVFWLGLLTVPVGTVAKAVIGDPADSNSWVPDLSMTVFTVGMAAVTVAAGVTRKLIGRMGSLAEGVWRSRPVRYRETSIGCSVIGIGIRFSGYFLPGSLVTAVSLLNVFVSVAVLMGTLHVIERSRGRRCLGLINGIPCAFGFFSGMVGFSKEGMLTTIMALFIAVAYARFRARLVHVVVFGGVVLYTFYALVPMAQIGRSSAAEYSGSTEAQLREAYSLLSNLRQTRQDFEDATEQARATEGDYFSKDVGFFGRLTRWEDDDRLISYTSHGNYVGYAGYWYSFFNWMPHLLLPNKEKYRPPNTGGNYYAREIGVLNSADVTTGVSFSPFAEAFHMDGWFSLLVVMPITMVVFFLSIEAIAGDARRTPWALFLAVAFGHLAPEGGLLALTTYMWYGNLALVVGILFTAYFAPAIGTLVSFRTGTEDTLARGVPAQFADRRALAGN